MFKKKNKAFKDSLWESFCHKCGRCCYEKHILHNGTLVVDYNKPCRFVDKETKLCTVYANRFNANKDCSKIGLFTVLFSHTLPRDCGYAVKARAALEKPWKLLPFILLKWQ